MKINLVIIGTLILSCFSCGVSKLKADFKKDRETYRVNMPSKTYIPHISHYTAFGENAVETLPHWLNLKKKEVRRIPYGTISHIEKRKIFGLFNTSLVFKSTERKRKYRMKFRSTSYRDKFYDKLVEIVDDKK